MRNTIKNSQQNGTMKLIWNYILNPIRLNALLKNVIKNLGLNIKKHILIIRKLKNEGLKYPFTIYTGVLI